MSVAQERGRVTHPERELWPGVTKQMYLDYVRALAEPLLAELRDRPLTVVRAPDGVGGFTFFQKQAPSYTPEWIRTIELPSPASKRKNVSYIVCDALDTLLWLGNQSCVELHPTLARTGSLHRPDVLVFDLDPPEGRIDLAVAAARAVKAVLDDAGLRAALKTTGGKGLHLYIPLQRRYGFDEVARAAERVAEEAITAQPALLTTEFKKADRGGRVLIDVGRNSPGATMVSAFSARAREGAPVSWPVDWEDLEHLDPSVFTVQPATQLTNDKAIAHWREARNDLQRLPARLTR